jgi:aspartyl-tRNA(Asn)/glutamyl-tRNA(Gln) amidotransferase subunit B
MLDLGFEAPKPKVIAGATGDWELVIGMEIHAQVASNAKLFSGASTAVGAEPNSNVAFVDAAMPGMLPVINEFCVEQAVRSGLGLKAKINLTSAFDRKNYFYPDLPQGYQISQLYHPIVGEGEVVVEMAPGVARHVRIERIHLEQDAGKSIHDMDPNMSFVDFNRTGVALMEIVSRPDIRGPEEAAAYVAKLRQILRYLGTCDGNMQNGNLRADVNVSVCRPGDYERYQATQDFGHLGTRCEIKNMNSLRFIQAAIEYEARRQIAILEDGGKVDQETRLYDPDKGETRSMRSKEEAHDYRYFPCPDLLPLEIEQAWVDDIAARMPELPDAKKARYVKSFMLNDYQAGVLTAEAEVAKAFEAQIKSYFLRFGGANSEKILAALELDGKSAGLKDTSFDRDAFLISNAAGPIESIANIIQGQIFALVKETNEPLEMVIARIDIGGLVHLLLSETITSKMGKELFEILSKEGGDAVAVAAARGMKQVTDTGAIERALDDLIAANPEQVEKAKVNAKLAGWFTGQVLKATGGKANPAVVNQMVAQKLGL